jgi:hypothetical protein
VSESAPQRFWTVDEANAVLPTITGIVEQARRALEAARERRAEVQATAEGNGRARQNTSAAAFNEAVASLAAEGIVLRDPDRGLVDFPARAPSGRVYWLCWLVGEPDVAWWHWPEDGFAGRTPLTEPPT